LEATDIHAENVLAAGEHPVLLDLEALFQPRVAGCDARRAGDMVSGAANYSVLRTGLLPYRMWADGESEGVDMSGLGAAGGQLSAHAAPRWEGVGTDEMRLARRRVEMPRGHNRPSLNGTDIDVLAYSRAVRDGFSAVYRLLLAHREELLAEGGPLARFAADEVRVIVRDTQTYAVLLRESFHPDALRDGLDRDRLFDRLWSGIDHRPHLARLIGSERADLQGGDIPLFTTRPASRDLWDCRGRIIDDYLDEPGLSLVRRRLGGFGEADQRQQLWFINAAFATLGRGETRARWSPYHLDREASPADRDRLLVAARAVGDRLEALAVRGDDDASWIGLMLTARDHWTLQPAGLDLYDGLPGIALFLAYLGAVTREPRYRHLAQAALAAVRGQVGAGDATRGSIGAFDGWGGIIYAYTHLGALWDDAALLDEAEGIVAALPPLIAADTSYDIIEGAAGCIGALAVLYRRRPSDGTLQAAIACGDRLLACAERLEGGMVGWSKSMALQRPLTGFSHGAAGIAWALLELAALSGLGRFRATALEALAYERALYAHEEQNWPDLRVFAADQRTPDGRPGFRAMWCHGAAGIGLGRLSSLRHLDDATSRAEIATALRTTAAHGFGESHALCHGDLGNLELLMQAGRVLDDAHWRREAWRMASAILASIERSSWVCGTSLAVESPGLMTGLAGIGYGLLRLAEPARVPSVLVLEPPPAGHRAARRASPVDERASKVALGTRL
jgi:type 2 lantibiotic biosynthesis protein LanM